jgi:single-strand DNA-binding protein
MNNCIFIGRLTKDIELRYTQNGKAVTSFVIAVNDTYKKNETTFINIIAWDKTAENCSKYIAKGSLVAVKGRLQNRSYEINNEKKYITEIVADTVEFLGSKKVNENDILQDFDECNELFD